MFKKDSERIKEHLKSLINRSFLSPQQKKWVPYLFHTTDIVNAIEIVKDNQLISRARRDRDKPKIQFVDSAHKDIIDSTSDQLKNFVRLYFRPKTPFQYNIEGIRPEHLIENDAHCPVPVIFLLDAYQILRLQRVEFTDGNAASSSRVKYLKSVDEYLQLPFQDIYHDGVIRNEEDKERIIFHRHAEVLVPDSLNMTSFLKYIIFRSEAECATFKTLLPKDLLGHLNTKLAIQPQYFNNHWFFIDSLIMRDDKKLQFFYNKDARKESLGPYKVDVELKNLGLNTDKKKSLDQYTFKSGSVLMSIPASLYQEGTSLRVTLKLDNHIACDQVIKLGDELV